MTKNKTKTKKHQIDIAYSQNKFNKQTVISRNRNNT